MIEISKEELKEVALATLRGVSANGDWDRFEVLRDKLYVMEQENPKFKTEPTEMSFSNPYFMEYIEALSELGDIQDKARELKL